MNFFNVENKWSHAICLLFVLVMASITIHFEPTYVTGPINTLGTIGFFSTLYGVLFAIVELLRAKTASTLATNEAKRVFSVVTSIITAREIAECQGVINMAASAIDEGKTIPSATLCQIIKIYSQVYHAELTNPESEHRKNNSTLQSYSFNPNINSCGVPDKSAKNVKRALLSISSHLGQRQGSTKNFSEY
jgi:hypothetical protein